MKHSMKRRVRALATVSACMVAAMAAARSTVPEDSAMERLRAAVDGEAARLRASLDDAEATRDWAEFLERKCTVDAAFAPLHLLLDAMEWQVPGASNDLLRAMRTEWRDAPVAVQWSHPDGDARARHSLAAWVPAPDGGQAVRVEFRTGSEAWVAGDAPPTIQWTAEGCWLTDTPPSTHAAGGGSRWQSPCASISRCRQTVSICGGTTPARASRTIVATHMPSTGARTRSSTTRRRCTRRSMRSVRWWPGTGVRRWERMPKQAALRPRMRRTCRAQPDRSSRQAGTLIRRPPSESAPCVPRTAGCSGPSGGTGTGLNCAPW